MRSLALILLATWLCLASAVFADDDSDAQSPGSDTESAPPSGPILQPADNAPVICDPNSAGFRFVEVRGSGFDAWATQRLVGNVVDANGVPQIQWGSVWVSRQGKLTLEVNLCSDPFRNRPALPAGDYLLSVGTGAGAPIATASITLVPPPEAADEGDQAVPPEVNPNASPTPTPAAFVLPGIQAQPTPTPLPSVSLPAVPPTPTATPRSGPGSSPQQPFPLGAPGTLADGWQLAVTGVTPDAYSGIHAAVPSAVAPAADQRDLMVRVQATYLGQGSGVFGGVRLALLSGLQTTYDQLHNNCGIIPDSVPPNLVTPGGSVRGNVCFTVRASDIDSLLLFDNQSSDNDRHFFSLK